MRLKLTFVFALALAVVLAGAGWFAYARVGANLDRALNEQLRARSEDLSALVLRGGALRTTQGRLVERGESFAQLLSRSGHVLDATPPLDRSPLLDGEQLTQASKRPVFVDRPSVPGLDEPARLLALPLRNDVLVAGATRENRAEILHSLRDAFLIGGPVALLLASLAGYFLAGAALRPIESMRRRAADISSSSLDERLPVRKTSDEVGRLGQTLNEMLARIEAGLERERRFVADASHQLRTPLAVLKTELELALTRGRTPDELRDALVSAAASTERLSRLADDLLLLARSDEDGVPLRVEPVDAGDFLRDVAARHGARVDAEPLVINADRLRLEQALTNMIDNARRYGGGDVTLTACRRNGSVELHVLDRGRGFPPNFIARAFERFSRGAASRGDGSGLGLAIVEAIARAHGGEAGAANRSEGGADVWLALPHADASAVEIVSNDTVGTGRGAQRRRVCDNSTGAPPKPGRRHER